MPISDAGAGGRWRWTPFGGLALLALAAGCQTTQFGASQRDAEIERVRALQEFRVAESGEARAVFSARGREVTVRPPPGYCLDPESVSVSERSAFVLVADCMNGGGAEGDGATAAETSSDAAQDAAPVPVFPGILTVSVSGEPVFGDDPAALASFESLLATAEGGRLLGRGDADTGGAVVVTRQVDGALYVLIEEATAAGAGSILAPRFWRAFTEINDRLVLVTVSGFADRPLAEDEMLTFLAAQMAELRAANGMPPSADETQIVQAVMRGVAEAQAADTGEVERAAVPVTAPRAPRRPG